MKLQMPEMGKLKAQLKRFQYVGLVLLLGVLLLAFPLTSEKEAKTTDQKEQQAEEVDVEALERRLQAIITQIDGVGQADVLVTLSAGSRQILAANEKVGESTTETETVLTKDSGSGQSAVTVQTIYPTYQGVLVVCDGGGDPTVKLQVLNALKALTGLSSEQISICARAGGS